MNVKITLNIPLCKGDFTEVPDVIINCYDSLKSDGHDYYKEGQELADLIYSQCRNTFYDGLVSRLKELEE